MADQPHFSLPMRFDGRKLVMVEQDTDDDIMMCILNLLLTRPGEREMNPTFGSPDITFMRQPIDEHALRMAIEDAEPRAIAAIEQNPSFLDELAVRVQISISRADQGRESV